MRCINIDWLEVYCLEDAKRYPVDAQYYRDRMYHVHERPYGTRQYKDMFTVYDAHDQPMIEIRRRPYTSMEAGRAVFMEPYACHLRLVNRYCYHQSPVAVLRAFMLEHGYTLKGIYRIDICLDFVRFDKGDRPADFMRRYMQGKYCKINQAAISAHGTDNWQERVWNSVSWGARTSLVNTKFYNKSLELAQDETVKSRKRQKAQSQVSTKMYNKSMELTTAHDKPYIRWAWYQAGLTDSPLEVTAPPQDGDTQRQDIWRVEFSIKASSAKWYLIEDCNGKKVQIIEAPHTLNLYDSREKLLMQFASLAFHYFHFKHYEEGVRKDRCKDKVLFRINTADHVYKVTTLAKANNEQRTPLQKYLSKLRLMYATYNDITFRYAVDYLIRYLECEELREDSVDWLSRWQARVIRQAFAEKKRELTEDELHNIDTKLYQLLHAEIMPPAADSPPANPNTQINPESIDNNTTLFDTSCEE